jgi:hypothetical protein
VEFRAFGRFALCTVEASAQCVAQQKKSADRTIEEKENPTGEDNEEDPGPAFPERLCSET